MKCRQYISINHQPNEFAKIKYVSSSYIGNSIEYGNDEKTELMHSLVFEWIKYSNKTLEI